MNFILTESRALRFSSFAVFYVAQGLPIGLITIALPAWLAEQGASPSSIATFVAISGLPWGFKLFAGPVMDRFSFLPMGQRRPWVVAAQFGLLISMVGMAFVPDPAQNVVLLTVLALLVNSCAAIQDVAVDGMAIDVLPYEERGRANAFMGFGQVAGYAGSGALCGTLLVVFGLAGAALTLAIGIALIFLFAIRVRERKGEKTLPWTEGVASDRSIALQAGDWASIFSNLLRVFFLPASLILIAVTFCWRVAAGFWITSAPVIVVQQLEYQSTDYAQWTGVMSFTAACIGILFGPLIDRVGAKRVFMGGMLGLSVLFVVTGANESLWSYGWVPISVLALEALFSQAIFISFIALHMNICWVKISATQFAIYMAWSNLARSIGAGIYGAVEEGLTPGQEFYVMGVFCLVGFVLLMVVNLDKHDEHLERLAEPVPS